MNEPTTPELLEKAKRGDRAAAEKLIAANMPLVHSIARRYAGRAEYEDLVQIGSLGLLKAVRGFEPTLGNRLSTYAVPLIAGEIKRFLRDDGAVKVSRRLKETAAKAAALERRIEAEQGRTPSAEKLAELLSIEPDELAAALTATLPCRRIDEPITEDGATAAELLPDGHDMEAEAVEHIALCELLDTLDEDERRMIGLRYFERRTQKETATLMGLSQAQVSRLERRMLDALRERAGA